MVKKVTFKLVSSLTNLLLIYKLTDKQKYTTKEDPKEHAHPTVEAGALSDDPTF